MNKIKIVSSEKKFKSLIDIIQSELNVNILEDKSRLRRNVDKELRFRYNYIKSEFACCNTDTEKHPSYDPYQLNKEVVELKKKLYALNKDNKLLHCEMLDKDIALDKAKSYTKNLKIREGRLENIFKLVEERTRIGTEDNILIKLNRFYNGVYG